MEFFNMEEDPDGCSQQVAVIMTGQVYREAGLKHSKHPVVEGQLYDKLCQIGKHKLRDDVRKMALSIALSVSDKEFQPTVAWLDNFMRRFCLSKKKMGFHSSAMLKQKGSKKPEVLGPPPSSMSGLTQEDVFNALGINVDRGNVTNEEGTMDENSALMENGKSAEEIANGQNSFVEVNGEKSTDTNLQKEDNEPTAKIDENNTKDTTKDAEKTSAIVNDKIGRLRVTDIALLSYSTEQTSEKPINLDSTSENEIEIYEYVKGDNSFTTDSANKTTSSSHSEKNEEMGNKNQILPDDKQGNEEDMDCSIVNEIVKENEIELKEEENETKNKENEKESVEEGNKKDPLKESENEIESREEKEGKDCENEKESVEERKAKNSKDMKNEIELMEEGEEEKEPDSSNDTENEETTSVTEGNDESTQSSDGKSEDENDIEQDGDEKQKDEGDKKTLRQQEDEKVNYSKEENKYYHKQKDELNKRLSGSVVRCTSCNEQVNHQIRSLVHTHPVLGVFICKRCVKRTMGRSELKKVESTENWACYVCDPSPMTELRALHRTILSNLTKSEEDDANMSRKELRTHKLKIKFDLLKRTRLERSFKEEPQEKSKTPKKKAVKKVKTEPVASHSKLMEVIDNMSEMLSLCLNNVKTIKGRWQKGQYSEEATEKTGKRILKQLNALRSNFELMENEVNDHLDKVPQGDCQNDESAGKDNEQAGGSNTENTSAKDLVAESVKKTGKGKKKVPKESDDEKLKGKEDNKKRENRRSNRKQKKNVESDNDSQIQDDENDNSDENAENVKNSKSEQAKSKEKPKESNEELMDMAEVPNTNVDLFRSDDEHSLPDLQDAIDDILSDGNSDIDGALEDGIDGGVDFDDIVGIKKENTEKSTKSNKNTEKEDDDDEKSERKQKLRLKSRGDGASNQEGNLATEDNEDDDSSRLSKNTTSECVDSDDEPKKTRTSLRLQKVKDKPKDDEGGDVETEEEELNRKSSRRGYRRSNRRKTAKSNKAESEEEEEEKTSKDRKKSIKKKNREGEESEGDVETEEEELNRKYGRRGFRRSNRKKCAK
ncbi:Transcriptional regulator ATRX-like 2, partial [Homarus americanus]